MSADLLKTNEQVLNDDAGANETGRKKTFISRFDLNNM